MAITVSDISSGIRPQFITFPTLRNLEENKPAGHSVVTVQATSSTGGSVKYYIAGGNVGQSFTIDESTGNVRVLSAVDYEMTQKFDLWIEARDAMNLSAFRKLVINVQDLNDNVPRFSQPIYSTSIIENSDIGSSVLQIMATDSDIGNNGLVAYRLSTTDSTFQINQDTGLITTIGELNREDIDSYNLIVEAVDQVSEKSALLFIL